MKVAGYTLVRGEECLAHLEPVYRLLEEHGDGFVKQRGRCHVSSDVHRGRGLALVSADGELVGYISYRRWVRYSFVEPISLVVAREHRGRGLGSELLGALAESVRQSHADLDVIGRFQPRGRRMLKRLGYVDVPEDRVLPPLPGSGAIHSLGQEWSAAGFLVMLLKGGRDA